MDLDSLEPIKICGKHIEDYTNHNLIFRVGYIIYGGNIVFLLSKLLLHLAYEIIFLEKKNFIKLQSFCMSQLESSTSAALSKEIAENTHELRKLMGDELQELNMKELQELEKLLGSGLRRVRDAKGEIVLKEITSLKWKGSQMMQENKRLKQVILRYFYVA
ncbi:MADS-box protein SVP-like [Prunus avium]|uniref:MADS-box protein SVP-like n=1 Tax=Prunus avium TaxID=42229 RepID=A0A6P5TTQ7_PRUAV|nr:MADS-box protein SVP-like [Prunus avium]